MPDASKKRKIKVWDAVNDCPRCVFVKFTTYNQRKQTSNLKLTINFGEHVKNVLKGNIKFGIRRGELNLVLEGAEIPFESNYLTAAFETKVKMEAEVTSGAKRTQTSKTKAGVNLNIKSMELTVEEEKILQKETMGSLRRKMEETWHQVRAEGSESNLTWVFEVWNTKPILMGGLFGINIATVKHKATNIKGSGYFRAFKKDVVITEWEGVLLKALARPKNLIVPLIILNSFKKDDGLIRFSEMRLDS